MLETLNPFSEENGGPLRIKHVSFVEGRGNIIGELVGMQLDFRGQELCNCIVHL